MMKTGYLEIKNKIKNAKLIAVSKLQSLEKIKALYNLGQRDFGENYVQELVEKMESLKDSSIRWHFIGHLQKNKIKYIIGKVALIHSVDSYELAQAINKEAQKKSIPQQNILLEVNLGNEISKTGFASQDIKEAFLKICALPNLSLQGLMSLPPLHDKAEEAHEDFRKLKHLLFELQQINPHPDKHPMNELSMGTSHDYQIAIEEGATFVRVGTLLFGERSR